MWKALLFVVIVAGAFATENNETKTGGPKDETASGHFYGGSSGGGGGGYGYNPPPPPPPPYYPPYGQPSYAPPIVDDYVCDIDATILVVANADRDGGYGNGNGYGNNNNNGGGNGPYGGGNPGYQPPKQPNADRLKCSVIATFDEATCTSCCRIAARRDRSIASSSIIGFIVDETQLDYDQNDNNNNNGPYRAKRGSGSENYGVPGSSPPRGNSPPRSPPAASPPYPFVPRSDANPLGPNARCVCCAPRKFGVPHYRPQPYPY